MFEDDLKFTENSARIFERFQSSVFIINISFFITTKIPIARWAFEVNRNGVNMRLCVQ